MLKRSISPKTSTETQQIENLIFLVDFPTNYMKEGSIWPSPPRQKSLPSESPALLGLKVKLCELENYRFTVVFIWNKNETKLGMSLISFS